MQKTNIGWTDYSANLLKYRNADGAIVWACIHASEGCRFCYSEALAKRWGRGEAFTAENMKKLTPFFDADEAKQILKSKAIAGKKVFVDDMTDLFGEWVPDEIIDQHFAVFSIRPDVTFQILTKRAQRMRKYFADDLYHMNRTRERVWEMDRQWAMHKSAASWPLPNVHLGVSVEDQQNAHDRLSALLDTPAAVRWASVEPLLEPVDLEEWIYKGNGCDGAAARSDCEACEPATRVLNGIVIGGESGGKHRPMPLESAINLARDAHRAGVAVYFKQDSGPRPGMQGRVPDDVWAMKEWPKVGTIQATATA